MFLRKTLTIFLCSIFFINGLAAQQQTERPPLLNYLSAENAWADSVFEQMTDEQRIGQLMMVAAFSDERSDPAEIRRLIKDYHVGGLIFFQGRPVAQARLMNQYQEAAEIPLMIAMDGEWGLGMRLQNTISYPYQMALGAVQNDSLIHEMGQEIARQFRRLGVHVNFAPVADVNNNPENPVISYRSFGEDPELVAKKSIAYATGLQEGGIIPTLKHFPGHGDTGTDSHYDLPLISHDLERLQRVELFPFKKAFKAGVAGVMAAHLSIPALDSTPNLPSTLSKPILTGLLREKMGYNGLLFTDAMNMQGLTKYFAPGEAELKALQAGNDVMEYVYDVPKAVAYIKKAMDEGKIAPELIYEKCRRVLKAKHWLGLHHYQPVELQGLEEDLNTPEARLLAEKLSAASLTLLKNEGQLLPLKRLDTLKIASLSVGATSETAFQKMLSSYTEVRHFQLSKEAGEPRLKALRQQLKGYNLLIVGLHQVGGRPRNNPGYSAAVIDLLNELLYEEKTALVFFRNPYALENYGQAEEAKALLMAYQGDETTQRMAAQMLFGAVPARGKLPVTINQRFGFGDGLMAMGGLRFQYTLPEAVGYDSHWLNSQVARIARQVIDQKAAPGGQVLLAKEGKVFYHKAFGHLSYEQQKPVTETDLYDLASITKITGPLPALMQLHSHGKIKLDQPFSDYWPDFKGTEKESMTFREVLAHQAQLMPYIVYWKNTLKKNGKFKWFTFKKKQSKRFPVLVGPGLYLHRKYREKIYRAIKESPLNEQRQYVYSGLSFLLYPEMIENLTGQAYESYVRGQFYDRLGAPRLTFNPLRSYSETEVAPTEQDDYLRKTMVRGLVHDEAAAMLGGASGNAGLFGTASDLAKIMQMYLNGGEYGGERYIAESTLREFTRYQFREEGSRRGLGFDKPRLKDQDNGFPSVRASDSSFGHSGFTGTFTWADPENQTLLVVLTNRVHPTRENRKIYQIETYQQLHDLLYQQQAAMK